MDIVCHRPGDDATDVHRFRYEVYLGELGWDSPEADHERGLLADALDAHAVVHSLVDDGRIVGTLRSVFASDLPDLGLIAKVAAGPGLDAFGPEAVATTSRFMLSPSLRGGTAILRLIRAAFAEGLERGVRLNYGDCSPHLLPFYEHMGYRRFAPAFNDPSYGWKFPILMLVGDRQRFEQVRSPLARLLPVGLDDVEARTWFATTYPDALVERSARFVDPDEFVDQVVTAVGGHEGADLLGGLDAEALAALLRSGTVVEAAPGDRIVREGETGTSLFLVLAGAVDVETGDEVVASVGAGSLLGEMAFLGDGVRTASAVARAPSQLLVLDGDATRRLLDRDAATAAAVTSELARLLAERGQPGGSGANQAQP